MRGDDTKTEAMFYYISPESMIPQDHPLRPIRKMVDQALAELSPEFDKMYSRIGRPSISPGEASQGTSASDTLHHTERPPAYAGDRL